MENLCLKTPVIRLLTEQQVAFRLLPHHTPAVSIEDAATQRGVRPAQMVKAILLRDMSDRYALACAPGDKSIDPRKVRAHLGWRRMTCVDLAQVPEITGYQIGAVTPLMLKQRMPIVFDPSLRLEPEVTISSGDRMAGIALALDDLLTLCQPEFAPICRDA